MKSHRLLGAFLLLAAPPMHGQYRNLAATDDGSVLYFSSSLRQKDTGQSFMIASGW